MAMMIAAVQADDFCCYHGQQLWLESGSAQDLRALPPSAGGRYLHLRPDDAGNPWRTSAGSQQPRAGSRTSVTGAVAYDYPAAAYTPGFYGPAFYGHDEVPLGLYGPVDPFLFGGDWMTGAPYAGWGPGWGW